MAKFYLTTAIDYANSTPHLGTAYEKIGADVIARFKRLQGFEVYFLMGNDEHSQNVRKKAQELGVSPKDYCDQMAEKFKSTWKNLHLSFDDFIQTSEKRHYEMVRELAARIFKAKDHKGQALIYKAPYEGHYCVSCEAFYQEKDLVEGLCPTHKVAPEWIKEENYFFRLSSFTETLQKEIVKHPKLIQPETRRNEILGLLKQGLEDVSISRPSKDWGIPLPFDEKAVAYVWFDALINYLSGLGPLGGEKHKKFWPCDLHVIGKDITRFHCVIWPAMLMAAQIPLPKSVWGHGFVSFKGEKMSKSRGNVADPENLAQSFGADPLRFHLMREIPWDKDGDFSEERLVLRYNSDLANGLGNLLSRCVSMAKKYVGEKLSKPSKLSRTEDYERIHQVFLEYQKEMDSYLISEALSKVWDLVNAGNLLVDREQPWVLAKDPSNQEKLHELLYVLLEHLRWISAMLWPVMPKKCEEIFSCLGISWKANEGFEKLLPPGKEPLFHFNLTQPIFPRIEEENKKK